LTLHDLVDLNSPKTTWMTGKNVVLF
jgi:hypothetical protein